jgi:hypothetical protein
MELKITGFGMVNGFIVDSNALPIRDCQLVKNKPVFKKRNFNLIVILVLPFHSLCMSHTVAVTQSPNHRL